MILSETKLTFQLNANVFRLNFFYTDLKGVYSLLSYFPVPSRKLYKKILVSWIIIIPRQITLRRLAMINEQKVNGEMCTCIERKAMEEGMKDTINSI